MKINFIFFGTGEEAVYALEALFSKGMTPQLIVTAPDRRAGRGHTITPPLAKKWAEKHNIRTYQPEKLDTEAIAVIAKEQADIFIVVGYGRILPESLLGLPKYKTINVHTSLLPLYRGPTPVEAPILSGDTETGVTVMMIDSLADHGPIISQEKYELKGTENTPELTQKLFTRGGEMLSKILPGWVAGKILPQEQDHEKATYTEKLKKENGLVDLSDDPINLWRKYRAYKGWPGTYFFENGKRMIITEANLEDGKFIIKKVIPEGGREKDYKN